MVNEWGYLDYAFWIGFAVIAFAALAIPVANILEDLFVHGNDGGHGRRTREFHDAGRAAGLSYGQRTDELFLNEMMAFLRRTASNAVANDPTLWHEHIEAAQKMVFERIAMENPDLLPAFGARIKGLSYGHILYPAEAKMVDKIWIGHAYKPTEDQRAALKIVRPG